jgi:hypothetical protein
MQLVTPKFVLIFFWKDKLAGQVGMQEYLAELSGTLARKQQRKNTVLSHIHKQAQLDRRAATYGFAIRPSNPADVSDPKAAKHFLNEVRSEIGHKVARINNPLLCSLDRDGEIAVRQLNDEIHRLLISRNRWLMRCADVGVELTNEERTIVTDEQNGVRLRKTFFGCSKELPEALRQREHSEVKRSRDTAENQEVASNVDDEAQPATEEEAQASELAEFSYVDAGDDIVAAYVASIRSIHSALHDQTLSPAETELRREEALCTRLSVETSYTPASTEQNSFAELGYVLDFCQGGDVPCIPTDDDVRKSLLERRKEAMRSQLSSMTRPR